MPAFGERGDSDTDSWKVVAFIRCLQQLSSSEELEMGRLNRKSPDEEREKQKERGPAGTDGGPPGTYGKFTNLV